MAQANEESARKQSRGRTAEIRFALYLARRNPLVLIGSVIAIGSIIIALIADLLVNPAYGATHDYSLINCWNNPVIDWHLTFNNCGSAQYVYPLGTDAFGRDLLKIIILAIPTDLSISFEIVLSAVAIGVTLGSVAAYAGGLLDEIILRVTDVFFAFPALVFAIVLATIFPRELFWLVIAVLVVWWPTYVRLIRSQVISEKEKPYVEALRSIGAGRFRILFRHILPNSIYPVLVQVTLDIGGVILTFSALMFLGFSPSAFIPELGNIVSSGFTYIYSAPWLIIFPGLVILVIALGFNLLGDGIRDISDPRLRR
jgi:peptide/nickel transport system permease protein